jgi:two-component system sensor histidine kinase/response regulator
VAVPDLRGRCVLVVDDNDKARLILRDMLESMSFAVDEAASGKEAVEKVRREASLLLPFEVVFMDWNMPGMDGIEAVKAIQGLGLAMPPHILMVTAYGREEVIRAADHIAIEQVLIKPVTNSLLFDAVIRVLGVNRGDELAEQRASGAEGPADLHGVHVLLVEDNEMNQIVARDLMEDAGIRVDIASNGQEAVDWLAARGCDIVLMDMQMPVMDGVTATILLRQRTELHGLPILAMTANAMSQDRQKCLAAGMNDYIAKPIDPDELFDKIRHWAKPAAPAAGEQPASPDAPSAAAVPAADGIPPIAGIDTSAGLKRVRGKVTLYRDLLERFAEGQAGVPAELDAAIAAGDFGLATRLAHTAKGLAATLGANRLSDLAAALEGALKQGTDPGAPPLESFAAELGSVVLAIRQAWCANPTADGCADEPAEAADPERFGPFRDRLCTLLEVSDSAALDLLEQEREVFEQGFGKNAYKSIIKAVKDYDFDLALEALKS